MPTLDISEYVDSSHGNLIEPPIAHQTLELGDESVSSKPLNKLTRILRVVSEDDALISIAVGASKPTQFLRAGVAETRVVQPDTSFVISAVAAEPNRLSAGPGGLWSFGDLSHALALIADPTATKRRLDAIAAAMAEAQALIAQAHKEVATSAATTKSDEEKRRQEAAEHAVAIAQAQRQFDEDCERRSVALTARATRLSEQESKAEADRAELEAMAQDLAQRAGIRSRDPFNFNSNLVSITDFRDRYPVLEGGFNLELLDRDRNRLFLGIGDDSPEALGAVADQVN
jgi:hypothetical protein